MTIAALAEKIAILEKENRIGQINAELSAFQFTPSTAVELTLQLYRRTCVRTVLGLVPQLDRLNIHSAAVDFAAAYLGILARDYRWIDRIEKRWEGRIEEFRAAFPSRHQALTEEIPQLATTAMEGGDGYRQASACLRLAKLVDKEVERIFPAVARPPQAYKLNDDTSLPRQTQQYANLPPVSRKPRRVAIVCRRWWSGPGSRPFEVGPRFLGAFQAAGWEAIFLPMESVLAEAHFHGAFAALRKLTETGPLDAVIFDQFGCPINQCMPPVTFIAHATRLRVRCPDLRIVPLYLDPWQKEGWAAMRETARVVDSIWSAYPSLDIWHDPAISGKVIVLPFPLGIGIDPVEAANDIRSFSFFGSVYQYNFYRAFWIAEAHGQGILIHFERKAHLIDDRLSAMESYARYLRTLKRERFPLNFSMRRDGTRVYTGRSLEALALGCCLVQEKTMDLHEIYTPGRHYLEFDTMDDLHDIARFIEKSPDEADKIAGEGRRLAAAHYSDGKIVETLERILWATSR